MGYRGSFHGEFASADASALNEANSRFTLYIAGTKTAVPAIGATDTVVVTDIVGSSAAAVRNTLYDGADNVIDAGEIIADRDLAVNGQMDIKSNTGHKCQVGTYPKLKTGGAGQVRYTIRGYIEQGALQPA